MLFSCLSTDERITREFLVGIVEKACIIVDVVENSLRIYLSGKACMWHVI